MNPSISKTDVEINIQNILWKSMQDKCTSLKRPLYARDVQELVFEIRQELNPKYFSPSVLTYIEAFYADFLYCFVNFNRGDANSDWSNLSSKQIEKISNVVFKSAQITPWPAEPRKVVRYLVAAVFYEKRHNDAEEKEKLLAMLAVQNDGYIVQTHSPEYVERENVFKNDREQIELREVGLQFTKFPSAKNMTSLADEFIHKRNFAFQQFRKAWKDLVALKTDLTARLNDADTTYVSTVIDNLAVADKCLADCRIGILGGVSEGKSSFLNALLGCPGLLASGAGAVTTVCTEIRYSPTKEYTVQLCFIPVKDIYEDVKYFMKSQDDNNDDDNHLSVVSYRLYGLFNSDIAAGILIPNSKQIIKYIGHKPLIYRNEDIEKVKTWLHDNLEKNIGLYEYALDAIYIEGPFETIPPGVILIDTPGLGDSEEVHSARTLDYLESFDCIWYANSYKTAMSKREDGEFLQSIQTLTDKEIHIIASQADHERDRTKAVSDKYLHNIRKHYYRAFLNRKYAKDERKRKRFENEKIVFDEMTTNERDEKQNIDAHVDAINIIFSAVNIDTNEMIIGKSHWMSMLQLKSKSKIEELHYQQMLLRSIYDAIQQATLSATMPTTVHPNRIIQSTMSVKSSHNEPSERWNDLLENYLQKPFQVFFDEENLLKMITNVKNTYDSFALAANTIGAVMNAKHRGFFKSRSYKNKKFVENRYIDLNKEIAVEWCKTKAISKWNEFLDSLERFQGDLYQSYPQLRAFLTNLIPQVKDRGDAVFHVALIKEDIRQMLTDWNVYRTIDRKRDGKQRVPLPTKEIIRDIFMKCIQPNVQSLIHFIASLMKTILEELPKETSFTTTNAMIRNILLVELQPEENRPDESFPGSGSSGNNPLSLQPPIAFSCAYSGELLYHPITLRGCRCNYITIDRQYLPSFHDKEDEDDMLLEGATVISALSMPEFLGYRTVSVASTIPFPLQEQGDRTTRRGDGAAEDEDEGAVAAAAAVNGLKNDGTSSPSSSVVLCPICKEEAMFHIRHDLVLAINSWQQFHDQLPTTPRDIAHWWSKIYNSVVAEADADVDDWQQSTSTAAARVSTPPSSPTSAAKRQRLL